MSEQPTQSPRNSVNARLARIEQQLRVLPGLEQTAKATSQQVGALLAALGERCPDRGRRIEALEDQVAGAPDTAEVGRLRSFIGEVNTRLWALVGIVLSAILGFAYILARKLL